MDLNNKCLLVLKPAQPFQHWLQTSLNAAEEVIREKLPTQAEDPVEVSLDDLQTDATAYLMPVYSPEQTADFIKARAETLFSRELENWYSYRAAWPMVNFSNFTSNFNFEFYYDWMNFREEQLTEQAKNIESIILVIKPKEKFAAEFLRTLLIEKFSLDEAEVEQKLDLNVIQRGSTAVITDITELDEVEYFLNRHAEEIFRHQLLLWGGEDSEDLWPRDTDWRAFGESFEIEIHRHNYLMSQ